MEEVNAIQPGHTLALFKDKGTAQHQLHTGIVVMFPSKHSKTCLQKWEEILKQSPILGKYTGFEKELPNLEKDLEGVDAMGVDQRALGNTKECQKEKGILKLNEQHLLMPDKKNMEKGILKLNEQHLLMPDKKN